MNLNPGAYFQHPFVKKVNDWFSPIEASIELLNLPEKTLLNEFREVLRELLAFGVGKLPEGVTKVGQG